MRRVITFLVSTAMVLGLFATAAFAGGHEWHEGTPPHGHVMLLGVEIIDATESSTTIAFRRCVEPANGKALPTPAHHHSIHTGNAGGSPMIQGPLFQAGNWVIPLNPYIPIPGITGCEAFSSGMTLPFGLPSSE